MDRVRNLLEQIQSRLEDLNKAERKVAEIILQNPQQATRFSIAALAQAASVSEPTVNRFCRSFGVSGYRNSSCNWPKAWPVALLMSAVR